MVEPIFNIRKAIEATAYLLEKADRRMYYIHLLKLLYLADRQMLMDYGIPLTGDRYYALKHGPILHFTYNLIKGEDSQFQEWKQYFLTQEKRCVLIKDPEILELSRADMRALDTVYEKYGHLKRFDLVNKTHKEELCPEWCKLYEDGKSCRMPHEIVLQLHNLENQVSFFEEQIAIEYEQRSLKR